MARGAHRRVRAGVARASRRHAARCARLARDDVQHRDHGRATRRDRQRSPRAARLDRRVSGGTRMTLEIDVRPREQSRARYPDETGYVERDGVRTYYEVYGSGEPTLLLFPPWQIVHSRTWKMQIPYFARHFRAVTFDARGNGRSDRPPTADAYADDEIVADALAVLDATASRRAVLVGFSYSG